MLSFPLLTLTEHITFHISIAFNSATKLEGEVHVLLHSAGTKVYKAMCNEAQSHSKPAQRCSVQKQMGSELLSFEEKDLCQDLK